MRPMMYISILMTIVYLCLAAFVYFSKTVLPGIDPAMKSVFAAIILMYGLFRAWKTYDTYFNDRNDA
jgi:uncharacterized membrane protein (DUF106 family)